MIAQYNLNFFYFYEMPMRKQQDLLYVENDGLGCETEIAPSIFHRTDLCQGGRMCQACFRILRKFRALDDGVIEHC